MTRYDAPIEPRVFAHDGCREASAPYIVAALIANQTYRALSRRKHTPAKTQHCRRQYINATPLSTLSRFKSADLRTPRNNNIYLALVNYSYTSASGSRSDLEKPEPR
jgi:hypothetical protein